MSDETQSKKIIQGKFVPHQIDYLCRQVARGMSTQRLSKIFIKRYPCYLKRARENGYSKKELLKVVSNRIYRLSDKRRPSSKRIENLRKSANYRALQDNLDDIDSLDDLFDDKELIDDMGKRVRSGEISTDDDVKLIRTYLSIKSTFRSGVHKYIKTHRQLMQDLIPFQNEDTDETDDTPDNSSAEPTEDGSAEPTEDDRHEGGDVEWTDE